MHNNCQISYTIYVYEASGYKLTQVVAEQFVALQLRVVEGVPAEEQEGVFGGGEEAPQGLHHHTAHALPPLPQPPQLTAHPAVPVVRQDDDVPCVGGDHITCREMCRVSIL